MSGTNSIGVNYMANFFLYGGTDWDSYDALAGGTIIARNGHALTYLSDTGFRVTLFGTGFRYDAQGLPTAGIIGQVTVHHGRVLLAEYKSVTMALTAYATLALGPTPDMEAVYRDLRDGSDLISDSALGRNLWGYDGNDTIRGNDGDDWMSGGAGIDSYDGGTGSNGLRFDDATLTRGVRVNLSFATGNIVDDGFGNTETAVNVQMAEGTAFKDRFTGSAGHNAFFGGAGNDILIGRDGNDSLDGGDGLDVFFGGNGVDVLTFFGINSNVVVNLSNPSAGVIINDGWGRTEFASGIEDVVGGSGFDTLTGNDLANSLWGQDGRDALSGGVGNDSLFGGTGDDWIFGGGGSNLLIGGAGFDTIYGGYDDILSFSAGVHGARASLLFGGNVYDDGHGSYDILYSVRNLEGTVFGDDLTGSNWHNLLVGLAGNDSLSGAEGNDSLYGGDGNDILYGGWGSNVLIGGRGVDRFYGGLSGDLLGFWDVDATGGGVNVNLLLAAGEVINDGYGNREFAQNIFHVEGSRYDDRITGHSAANDLWGGQGNDTLEGKVGNDGLYGGDGKDRIIGGSGTDYIVGGNDADTLTGGTEADYFYFMGPAPGSDGVDTLTDFTAGQDRIGLNVGWANGLTLGNLNALQFRSGAGATAASTTEHRVIYDTATGGLYFDADGLGGQSASLLAVIGNTAALTWASFFTVEPF